MAGGNDTQKRQACELWWKSFQEQHGKETYMCIKAHRICLYVKYPSVKEPQTGQSRLMWNLHSPWDIASIGCFFLPLQITFTCWLQTFVRLSLQKRESFFSCPVFVLHKIWGLAALKETKPKPNQEGSVQAAERQLVGSDAHTCKSAAAVSGTSAGAASNKGPTAP